ncbi:terpene synthase [Micromonospora sp. NPDC049559]|uniref:terpene synthase family protein n=1 Tax=Micromonospora sp. NPDC049559 TaxID=3155923 RepID=UPI003427F433
MRRFVTGALAEPPYPARVNERAGAVGQRSAEWAMELGLVSTSDAAQRLDRANAGDLAGRACPDAGPEQLALLTDLITWLFSFDDSCDDDGLGADPGRLAPVVARLLQVLERLGGPVPAELLDATGPTGTALHDLCRRVRDQHRPVLLLRFTRQVREYLLALLWEAANRKHHRVPGISEYVQYRRHTGAVYPSFTLTDIGHGAEPDAPRLADPRLSELEALAADLVCWCNDVFSYDKERRLETDGHNLVLTIAREAGQDEYAALAEAVRRFNTALAAYDRLETAVLAEGDPDVTRFAAARRCWIRGTYDWSLGASRYQ